MREDTQTGAVEDPPLKEFKRQNDCGEGVGTGAPQENELAIGDLSVKCPVRRPGKSAAGIAKRPTYPRWMDECVRRKSPPMPTYALASPRIITRLPKKYRRQDVYAEAARNRGLCGTPILFFLSTAIRFMRLPERN